MHRKLFSFDRSSIFWWNPRALCHHSNLAIHLIVSNRFKSLTRLLQQESKRYNCLLTTKRVTYLSRQSQNWVTKSKCRWEFHRCLKSQNLLQRGTIIRSSAFKSFSISVSAKTGPTVRPSRSSSISTMKVRWIYHHRTAALIRRHHPTQIWLHQARASTRPKFCSKDWLKLLLKIRKSQSKSQKTLICRSSGPKQ